MVLGRIAASGPVPAGESQGPAGELVAVQSIESGVHVAAGHVAESFQRVVGVVGAESFPRQSVKDGESVGIGGGEWMSASFLGDRAPWPHASQPHDRPGRPR